MVTWFVFFLIAAIVFLLVVRVVGLLDGEGRQWNNIGAGYVAAMATALFLICAVGAVGTGAWSLAAWITR